MRLMSKSRYISAFMAYLWFYDSVRSHLGKHAIWIYHLPPFLGRQILLYGSSFYWGGKYYYMALSAARRWPRSPCLTDQKDFLNNPSKHMLYAIHKSRSPFYGFGLVTKYQKDFLNKSSKHTLFANHKSRWPFYGSGLVILGQIIFFPMWCK